MFIAKDMQFQAGKFSVALRKSTDVQMQGSFEHDELGDERGGGLWFQLDEQGRMELIDYDGVPSLPQVIADYLRYYGFYLDELCDSDKRREDPPLYNCYWSLDSYSFEGEQIPPALQGLEAFAEGNGYTLENFQEIRKLEIGQSYINHEHGAYGHIVTRVK